MARLVQRAGTAMRLAAAVLAVVSAAEPPPAPPTVLHSSSRRIRLVGFDSRDALVLAQWAEEVVARTGERLGVAVPFAPGETVEISAVARADAARGAVIPAQGEVDGLWLQQLTVENPRAVEEEDLLEGLTRLLINRCLAARQTEEMRRRHPPSAPAWLVTGVAQSSHRLTRARNLRFARDRLREGGLPPAGELLARRDFPPGRGREKAFCGVLVQWLADLRVLPAAGEPLLRGLAAGGAMGAADTVSRLGAWVSVDAFDAAFRAWIGSRDDLGPDLLVSGLDQVRALDRALVLRPADYAVAAVDLPVTVALRDLPAHREAAWLAPAVDAALARLGRLLPRIDPELAPAVQGYLDYLGRVRAVPTARDAARRLRSLEAADAVRARYARAATDRARYLDDVEARERTGRLAGGEAWTEERLRVSKYLDAVERARGASAPP